MLLWAIPSERPALASSFPSIVLEEDMVLGDEVREMIGVVSGVVEDSKHFIYIADLGFQQIQKYSPEGELVDVFGSVGEGPGELMFPFSMTISGRDELYFAGPGGRVTIWTTEGDFVREFRRLHPDGDAKSIRVARDGKIFIAVLDILEQTVIDVYSSTGEYINSFGHSYAVGRDVDARTESFVGGGSLDLMYNGMVAYTQQAPYQVVIFKPTGEKVFESVEGGEGFVELPPEPEYGKKTFRMGLTSSSVEITCLGNRLLNCAIRGIQEQENRETLLTLYDDHLKLLARTVLKGFKIVVGKDAEGRVFIFSEDGDVPQVRRARLSVQ